jgi:acetyl/propionyl-CoA carboxylase alpha subunit
MSAALAEFSISGLTTNLDFLIDLLADEDFAAAEFTTTTVEQRYGRWQPGNTGRRQEAGPAETAGPTRPWKSLGRWRLGNDTQSVSYRARTAGDADVSLGQTHRFEAQVISPMPGKVIEVLIAHGDVVEADAPLLLLEAMKMEQTIRAPSPARVKSINIEVGTMVGPGQVLVILEEV